MSESDAIKGIRRAAKQREYADRLRHEATGELRERVRQAQAEGVPIARIAREARLSKPGRLRPAGPGALFLSIRSKSSRFGIGMRCPAGVVCFGSSRCGVSAIEFRLACGLYAARANRLLHVILVFVVQLR